MEEYLKIAEEEEAHWQATYDAIHVANEQTKKNADQDFEEAKRLTAEIVNTRREEDQQQIASDEAVAHGLSRLRENLISKFDLLLEQPYFARIQCEEDDRKFNFYLSMASFPDRRIIDWREAPIAKLYYEYNQGEDYSDEIAGRHREGEILIRRGFKGKGRELNLIELPNGQIVKKEGQWKFLPFKAEGGETQARSRSGDAGGHLPPILSLITAEQYQLITTHAEQPLLIEGIAGSGKTTVALHRLSWLLHKNNRGIREEKSCIIVFNQILKFYIQECLPELGMKQIKIYTYADWVKERLGLFDMDKARQSYAFDHHIDRLKNSPKLKEWMSEYCSEMKEQIYQEIKQNFKNHTPQFLGDFESKAEEFLSEKQSLGSAWPSFKMRVLQWNPQSKDLCQKIQTSLEDIRHDYLEFWKFLQNENVNSHNLALNFDPLPPLRETQTRLKDHFYQSQDYALMIELAQTKLGEEYYGRRIQFSTFDHIMVDEVQDLSPACLKTIHNSVAEEHQVTLVGDFGQQIYNNVHLNSFSEIIKTLGLDAGEIVRLPLSFRSTQQILELAHHVRNKELKEEETQGVFVGPEPEFNCLESDSDYEYAIAEWITEIKQRYPDSHSAVLCRNGQQAKELYHSMQNLGIQGIRLGTLQHFTFDPGITITHVHQVKGLEFRHVLIANPSEENYPSTSLMHRNLMYVAVTRAEERLDFLLRDEPSKILPEGVWTIKSKPAQAGPDMEWFDAWSQEE